MQQQTVLAVSADRERLSHGQQQPNLLGMDTSGWQHSVWLVPESAGRANRSSSIRSSRWARSSSIRRFRRRSVRTAPRRRAVGRWRSTRRPAGRSTSRSSCESQPLRERERSERQRHGAERHRQRLDRNHRRRSSRHVPRHSDNIGRRRRAASESARKRRRARALLGSNDAEASEFMKTRTANRITRARGFTLIELMITIVVGVILMIIAVSSYGTQVRKSRRTDAKTAVLDLAGREERNFSTTNTYALCRRVWVTRARRSRSSSATAITTSTSRSWRQRLGYPPLSRSRRRRSAPRRATCSAPHSASLIWACNLRSTRAAPTRRRLVGVELLHFFLRCTRGRQCACKRLPG